MIEDGKWHKLSEIAEELNLPLERITNIANYLSKGRFIHYDEERGEIRIQEWIKQLPKAEWTKNKGKSLGTVIIQKGTVVSIQGTLIHNELDTDIEVNFLIKDGKLKEIQVDKPK